MMPDPVHVLYVDDEPDLLEIARIFLEQDGEFCVGTAISAQAALASSSITAYDAIISDYQMPGMDGIAFLKAVRERFGDIPFILFTGRGREEVVIAAINNGADFYLQKGGDPRAQFAELMHKVRQAVRRKQAELERIRSEEKFSKLFTANPSLGAITDMATGNLIDVNEAFIRVTGYTREDFIGKSAREINDFIDPADRERIAEELTKEGMIRNFEIGIRTKSGITRTLDITGQCITVGNKSLLFTQAVDITDRKQAEDALRMSEERYRAVINDQSELIARFTPDGTVTFTNEAYRQYFLPMLTLPEFEGKKIHDLMQVGNFEEVDNFLGSLTPEAPIRGMDRRVTGPDKTPHWQHWSVRALFDKDGRPAEYQVVGHDITEQKRAEDALRESEAKYRDLAELLPQMIFELDMTLKITYANRHARTALGLTARDLEQGVNALSIIDPLQHARVRENVQKSLGHSPFEPQEYTAVRRDGSTFPVLVYSAPFYHDSALAGFRGVMVDISARKRMEEELRKNEQTLRRLADNAPDMIYRMSLPEAKYEYVSPASAALTGYAPKEFYADPGLIWKLVHPAWQEYLREQFAALLRGAAPPVYEFQIIDRSGAIRWINQRNVLIADEQGKNVAIEGIVTDITRQKNTERELLKSEQRFLAVSGNAGSWIWETDAGGVYRYSSPAVERILGYRPDELVGKVHFYDLFDPSVQDHLKEISLAAFGGGEPFRDFINLNRHKNGTPVLLRTSGTPVFGDDGRLSGYCGIDEDITRQKEVEDALRQSEERFRSMAERSSDLILVLNREMSPTYVSPSARRIVGYEPEELVGKPPKFAMATIFADSSPVLMSAVNATLKGKVVEQVELQITRKNGNPAFVSMQVVPVLQNGALVGVQISMRDVTARKKAELALRRSRQLLEDAMDLAHMANWEYDIGKGVFILDDHFFALCGTTSDREGGSMMPAETYSREFVHPDDRHAVADEMKKALQSTDRQYSARREHRIIRRDGEVRHVLVLIRVIRSSDGRAIKGHGTIQDITEQKLAEDALRESEERYRLFLMNANDGIMVNELTKRGPGKFIEINDVACRILGLTHEELREVSLIDLDTPEMKKRARAIVAEIMKNRHAVFQTNYRRENSREKYLDISVSLFEVRGQTTMLSVVRDITEMKTAEAALQAIVKSMVGTTGFDALRKITENVCSWLGADCAMVGEIQPDGQTVKTVAMLLDGKEIAGFSYTLRGTPCENVAEKGFCLYPDDAIRLFPESRDLVDLNIRGYVGTPLRDSRDEVIGVLCALSRNPLQPPPSVQETMDIIAGKAAAEVERMRMDRALQESEERFRGMAERSSDLIFILNKAMSPVFVSPSARSIIGYDPEELVGRPPGFAMSTIFSESGPDFMKGVQENLSGRSVENFEIRLKKKDGTTVYVTAYAVPVLSDGLFAGAQVSMRDITARKEAEDALRESEEAYRLLADNVHDVIWTADMNMRLTYISPSVTALRGLTMEEAMAEPLRDAMTPGSYEILMENRRQGLGVLRNSGRVPKNQALDLEFRCRDGSTVWTETVITPVFDRDNRPIGVVGVTRDNTLRKQAEAALRESEAKYRLLADKIHDVIWTADNDLHITYISPSVMALRGLPPEEAMAEPFSDALTPASYQALLVQQQRWTADFQEGSISSDTRTIEMEFRRKDGSVVWTETVITPTFDNNRRPAGIVGVTRDITLRRRAEEAILESERKVRTVLENVPDLIIVHKNGRILYANPVMLSIMGTSPLRLLNKPLLDFIAPEHHARVTAAIARRMETGRDESYEIDLLTRAQGRRTVLVRGTIIEFEGSPAILNVLSDITEQKQVEAALRESEEKYRLFVETSPDLIWELDLQGKFRYISPRVTTMLGYTPEETIGRSITDLVSEEDKAASLQKMAEMISSRGAISSIEVSARHRSGSEVILEIRPALLTGAEGMLKGLRGVAVDITERKRAEEALRKANRQLSLLSGITRHDILNKVSVILGFLKISGMKFPDPALAGFLGKMESATLAIKSQIEFTKIYQDLGSHEPQWIDLESAMPRSSVPTALSLKTDLRGVAVYADPMLERVFFNLLDNSVRHGERVTEIRVSRRKSGEDLVIVWEDNGVGIAADEKEKIFERGFGKHTGLGMFLVLEILSLTGITITETGEPGKGARFEIMVPDGAYRITGGEKS